MCFDMSTSVRFFHERARHTQQCPLMNIIHKHLASWAELSYSYQALQTLGAIQIYNILLGIYYTDRDIRGVHIYYLLISIYRSPLLTRCIEYSNVDEIIGNCNLLK